MKILFTTDLHGAKGRYFAIQQAALQERCDVVCLGADILPKDGNIFQRQYGFIKDFLPGYLSELSKNHYVFLDFGNDDLGCYYLDFLAVLNGLERCFTLNFSTTEVDGVVFRGYNWVPDYPFGLKDWCKIDLKASSPCPTELSPPIRSVRDQWTGGRFERIENLKLHLTPSIEEVLEAWLPGKADSEEIWVMHSPPKTIGLDIVARGESVGSSAITNAIIEHKPRITLHGHIHESYGMTGLYHGKVVPETLSIQPGTPYKRERVSYVILDLDEGRHPKVRYIDTQCVS